MLLHLKCLWRHWIKEIGTVVLESLVTSECAKNRLFGRFFSAFPPACESKNWTTFKWPSRAAQWKAVCWLLLTDSKVSWKHFPVKLSHLQGPTPTGQQPKYHPPLGFSAPATWRPNTWSQPGGQLKAKVNLTLRFIVDPSHLAFDNKTVEFSMTRKSEKLKDAGATLPHMIQKQNFGWKNIADVSCSFIFWFVVRWFLEGLFSKEFHGVHAKSSQVKTPQIDGLPNQLTLLGCNM